MIHFISFPELTGRLLRTLHTSGHAAYPGMHAAAAELEVNSSSGGLLLVHESNQELFSNNSRGDHQFEARQAKQILRLLYTCNTNRSHPALNIRKPTLLGSTPVQYTCAALGV